jgi:glutathione reductase (NADPH)
LYAETLARRGVEVLRGHAHLVDRHTVVVKDGGRPGGAEKRFRARTILIATGSRPRLPPTPGIEHAITSDELFHLEHLPAHVTIAGGGYIAVEFAGILSGFGCRVTLVHRHNLVLRGFDRDVRRAVTANLAKLGVTLELDNQVTSISRKPIGQLDLTLAVGASYTTGALLCAVGRVPVTAGLGLEQCGVLLSAEGAVAVDSYSQSSVDNIYAVGDVTNRANLTPVAIREAQAFADTVFGGRDTPADHNFIPTAVFAQPPAATVGMTEEEAIGRGHRVEIYASEFRPLLHTLTGRDEKVMMKLCVDGGNGRILGLHVVGKDAPEIVQSAAIAVRMGATKADFDATCALHPTTAEELVLLRVKREHPVKV